MKNKKVEELVERVAQKLYDQYRGVDGKYIKSKPLSLTNRDSWKEFYIRALDVLSRPGLALIVSNPRDPQVDFLPVIPLVEALKEATDGND